MSDQQISPVPTDDESAAIMAAVEALWPRPAVADDRPADGARAWRFSGRWWHRDRFAVSERPWS